MQALTDRHKHIYLHIYVDYQAAFMGQVTIYLEEEIEEKMSAAAESANLSKSKWIAGLIKSKVANEWPESVVGLAGAWKDLPLAEESRKGLDQDTEREAL